MVNHVRYVAVGSQQTTVSNLLVTKKRLSTVSFVPIVRIKRNTTLSKFGCSNLRPWNNHPSHKNTIAFSSSAKAVIFDIKQEAY